MRSGVPGNSVGGLPLVLPSITAGIGATGEAGGAPTFSFAAGFSRRAVALGLDRTMELRGGDRLGPTGAVCDLAIDWQPEFMRHVEAACSDQRVCGREWFALPPTLLVAQPGAGRTHLARRLAVAAGVPHVALDARQLARTLASLPDVPAPIPPVVAIAISRCANPVISVENVDAAGEHAHVLLARLIDPEECRKVIDTSVGAILDFGHVTWLIQTDAPDKLPHRLVDGTTCVRITRPTGADARLFLIDLIAEVISDRWVGEIDHRQFLDVLFRAQAELPRTSVAELYDRVAAWLARGEAPFQQATRR